MGLLENLIFWGVTMVASAAIGYGIRQRKDDKAQRAAIMALLRNEILRGCRQCINIGYKSAEDVESIGGLYDAYNSLGGDGGVKAIYSTFKELPGRANHD